MRAARVVSHGVGQAGRAQAALNHLAAGHGARRVQGRGLGRWGRGAPHVQGRVRRRRGGARGVGGSVGGVRVRVRVGVGVGVSVGGLLAAAARTLAVAGGLAVLHQHRHCHSPRGGVVVVAAAAVVVAAAAAAVAAAAAALLLGGAAAGGLSVGTAGRFLAIHLLPVLLHPLVLVAVVLEPYLHLGGCQVDHGGQVLPFGCRQVFLLLEAPLQLVNLKTRGGITTLTQVGTTLCFVCMRGQRKLVSLYTYIGVLPFFSF